VTWSGHGRRPGWIKDALAMGRNLEEFLIAKVTGRKKKT
jgi:DNA-binding protein H-NS